MVRVRKWGNSLEVHIPKIFAERLGLAEGTEVDFELWEGKLLIKKISTRKLTPGSPGDGRHGKGKTIRPGEGWSCLVAVYPPEWARAVRAAVVLSPRAYNEKVGLALFCPVASKRKGYPFEVVLPPALPVHGVILSNQMKSLDWQEQ